MADSPFTPDEKPSFLSRLLARRSSSPMARIVRTTRTEHLNLTVPSERADAIRAAVEAWLAGRGVAATLTVSDAGSGRSKLTAEFKDNERRVDLSDDAVESDLQDVVTRALGRPAG